MWFLAAGGWLRPSECVSIISGACPLFKRFSCEQISVSADTALAGEPRSRTLPNCLFSSGSDRSRRIIPHCPPRLTTFDGRLVRAHCSSRHCIHSFDFLAVKVSPALLILFVNIVLLLKNCILVINP